jgi:hypothetical protein
LARSLPEFDSDSEGFFFLEAAALGFCFVAGFAGFRCCFFLGFSSGVSNSLSLGGEDRSSEETALSGSFTTFFLFLGHGSLSSEARFLGLSDDAFVLDFNSRGGELGVSS